MFSLARVPLEKCRREQWQVGRGTERAGEKPLAQFLGQGLRAGAQTCQTHLISGSVSTTHYALCGRPSSLKCLQALDFCFLQCHLAVFYILLKSITRWHHLADFLGSGWPKCTDIKPCLVALKNVVSGLDLFHLCSGPASYDNSLWQDYFDVLFLVASNSTQWPRFPHKRDFNLSLRIEDKFPVNFQFFTKYIVHVSRDDSLAPV